MIFCKKVLLLQLLLGACLALQKGPGRSAKPLPRLREQADIQKGWIEERMTTFLPELMREYGVEMWFITQKEYQEDTVWRSYTDPTRMNARRRTIDIFILNGTTVETTQFVGFSEIWPTVGQFVREANPATIQLNIDETFAFSDGLSIGEYTQIQRAFGPELMSRVVTEFELPINFIALRPDSMLPMYQQLMEIVWEIIDRAFSSELITPGVTSCNDVSWWMKETALYEYNLPVSFQPSVGVQRQGFPNVILQGDTIILPGDHIWTDFGVIGLNLWTDTQHQGYVLRSNETTVPAGLQNGLRLSNTLQDFVLQFTEPGLTGNEVLLLIDEEMRRQGIEGKIYCHPIGDFMHSAGPTLGLVDRPNEPIPIKGDVKFRAKAWHSVELVAYGAVPEWGNQIVEFRQEEDAAIDENGDMEFVLARQSEFHVVDWENKK